MVTLNVRASDPAVKAIREAICNEVLSHFNFDVPGTKSLCFVDDVDFGPLKSGTMKANRGLFLPDLGGWIQTNYSLTPPEVSRLHGDSLWTSMAYSSLIYVHGSTCEPRESLILTLAHEPQHFTQFTQHPNSYYGDFFLTKLLGNRIDCPSEYDALLRSKSVATELCGLECIIEYVQARIDAWEDETERRRWQYFLSLPLTYADSFAEKTRFQCQQNKERLHNMIASYPGWYRESFPIDFAKAEWWEE
jgi:hypothetical protein